MSKRRRQANTRWLLSLILMVAVSISISCATAWADTAFKDMTQTLGLTGIGNGQAAWADYNNDGWPDLYVEGTLWQNEKGLRFTKVAPPILHSYGGLWADYDNDGYLDLYCWGGGKLYHNLQGKGLAEHTDKIPPRPTNYQSQGAAWGDFDGDGYIDLYVGGYEIWKTQDEFPDVIYRNKLGKSFTETWRTKGKPKRARGITAADFDEDGDLDVYVSNYRLQPNILWRNDGTGVFEDVAATYGVAGDGEQGAWGHTIGSAWGDLDNDGHFDLFVGNFSHPPAYQDRPKFYKNLGPSGNYHFQDKSSTAGLAWQESYASPALGDFDNDGDLDLFYTTVYPVGSGGIHNYPVLYRNDGDWAFTDVTAQFGLTKLGATYQAAWADYDNDGYLDLITNAKLFRNPGGTNHWLKVKLRGGSTPKATVNAAAIGAQLRIKLPGLGTISRQVEGATGEGNQNDLTLHFGLGSYDGKLTLQILWPNGSTQTVKNVAVDQTITIHFSSQSQQRPESKHH